MMGRIYYYDELGNATFMDRIGLYGPMKATTGELFMPNLEFVGKLEAAHTRMSVIEAVITAAKRVAGIYRYKSAEAILERSNLTGGKDNSGWGYRLTMSFDKLADAVELYKRAFSGQAYPETSFDEPQPPFRWPRNLTDREMTICKGIAYDESAYTIGQQLGLKESTTKKLIQAFLKKRGGLKRTSFILSLVLTE